MLLYTAVHNHRHHVRDQSITSQHVFLLLHPVRQRKISRVWAASALKRFYSRRSPAAARWRKPPHIYSTKTRLIQPVRERARALDREHGSDFMSTEETSIRIWNNPNTAISHLQTPIDTQMLEYCRSADRNCETLLLCIYSTFLHNKSQF